MTEVKEKNVKSWAENHVINVEFKTKQFEEVLTKEEMVGLLKESTKIIKRLLKEYD